MIVNYCVPACATFEEIGFLKLGSSPAQICRLHLGGRPLLLLQPLAGGTGHSVADSVQTRAVTSARETKPCKTIRAETVTNWQKDNMLLCFIFLARDALNYPMAQVSQHIQVGN